MWLLHSALAILHFINIVTAADSDAWKSRSIYFALTDRIARSSSDSGGRPCADLSDYCGGTFNGLESKLDYIKSMGFDAIWISPIIANSAGGYHGYWAQDLYSINPSYGTAIDLQSLVSTAHAKGIYVMVDVTVNNMGFGAIIDNRPAPLNESSSYHVACDINYLDQNSIENCRVANLPDVYTQRPEIRVLYQDWIRWLVTEFAFDGVRISTVKHVEKDFWPNFSAAVGVFTMGDVLDGNPDYIVGYASLMPGLLNYAIYFPMINFYQNKGSAQDLVDMHDYISSKFPDPAALGTFLDNHDNARWLSRNNDVTLLKNALAYIMLSRGIPILYYGTEQGFSGGVDPGNREDLWRSSFDSHSDLYRAISQLLLVKKQVGGLADNDQIHLYVTENAYAFSRVGGHLIVLTTNVGDGINQNHCFNSRRAYSEWSDIFGGGSYSSDGNGNLCVTISNGQPVVLLFVKSSNTASTTIDMSATSTFPISPTQACTAAVSVIFTERVVTKWGDTIRIAGNTSQLGNWNTTNAPALSASWYTSNNPVWNVTLNLPSGQSMEYKFIRVTSSGRVTWESDPNRVYTVPSCVMVNSQWQ